MSEGQSWWKATRPDGTSFHDATTRWVVGETTSLPVRRRRKTMCGAGVLHAATVPAETLVGGGWPCRLFRRTRWRWPLRREDRP